MSPSTISSQVAITERLKEVVNIGCFDSAEEARGKIKFDLAHEDKRISVVEESYRCIEKHSQT